MLWTCMKLTHVVAPSWLVIFEVIVLKVFILHRFNHACCDNYIS